MVVMIGTGHKSALLVLVVFLALVVALTAALLGGVISPKGPTTGIPRSEMGLPVSARSVVDKEGTDVLPGSRAGDLASLVEESLPRSFQGDLAAAGLPAIPTARKEQLERLASLTLEEQIQDLGNTFMRVFSQGTDLRPIGMPHSGLGQWTNEFSNRLGVVRLIEEGRDAPERIGGLLVDMLRELVLEYPSVAAEVMEHYGEFVDGRYPRGENWPDPYYEEHFRYESPFTEIQRMFHAATAALYILSNIEGPDYADVADAWGQLEKCGKYSLPFDVYVVHHAFSRVEDGGEHWVRHQELMGETTHLGETIQVSASDALWDVGNPYLAMQRVPTSTIATIEVLRIPETLGIDDETAEAVLSNFHDFVVSH